MRYNLESTLPIDAFSPRGGKNNPFVRGMTLEGGGGGGGILGGVSKVFGGVAKGVTGAVKGIVQPVYNATLKNIPGVDNALVGLDKAVGKTIPGGWGTVASIASTFIPGAQFMPGGYLSALSKTGLATGLGALSGSGVMRGKNEFNLQGAIMGGAMAYGASQLSAGLQEAGKSTTDAIAEVAKGGGESALTNTGSAVAQGSSALTPTANSLQNIGLVDDGIVGPSLSDYVPKAGQSFAVPAATEGAAEFGLKNIAANTNIPAGEFGLNAAASTPSGLGTSAAPSFLDKVASGTQGTLSNIADAGQGIKNLTGFGSEGISGISKAASAFADPITQKGLVAGFMGYSGMVALEEQQKYLDQQLSSGSIGNEEYNAAKAKIDEQVTAARANVAANPLQTSAATSNVSEGPSLYAKKSTGFDTLYDKDPSGGTNLYEQTPVGIASGGMISRYATGGVVNPFDDQTGMPSQTPMQRLETGGITGYASGGMPRFLSGGGDGMSDSIKASINGSQEARLADGEFVIPADVVSHIGNGSSKAGAKQLYSMMDRVRQARVGTKKQGKQINPRKFLAA